MTKFVLIGGAVADVAQELTYRGHCRVVYTASIGDAASPVWVAGGDHHTLHGQVADYQHDVDAWAEQIGAAAVTGWWDESRGWMQTVYLPDGVGVDAEALAKAVGLRTLAGVQRAEANRHAAMVAEMDRLEAELPAREAAAAKYRAECEDRAAEYRPLYDAARAKVRVTGKGKPHGGDMADLEWAYGKACGTRDCYGEYDRQHGLRVLQRLAEQGFAEAATA